MNTTTPAYNVALNYLMLECGYSNIQARALLTSKIAPLIKLACKAQNKDLVAALANRVFIPA